MCSYNIQCFAGQSKTCFFGDFIGEIIKIPRNTPGTAGGPGGRDRMLAVKRRKNSRKSVFFFVKKKITPQKYFFSHISASYAKILGETNFQPWEFPRSGSKAKDGEKRERERAKVGNNNGQLCIATPPWWRTQAALAKKTVYFCVPGWNEIK